MSSVLSIIWIVFLYIFLIPLLIDYLLGKVNKDEMVNALTAFVLSMIIFIVFGFTNMHLREYEYQYTQEIVAIQDSETMLISRNSSSSEMYYYFMVEDNGAYKSRKANQDVSYIRYTENEPRLEVYKKESTSKFAFFFMPIDSYVDDYRYDFYVPKGTIKEEFNIDLN